MNDGHVKIPSVTVDTEADAAYVLLVHPSRARVARTVEVAPWCEVDYDAAGNVIGVELLTLRITGGSDAEPEGAPAAEFFEPGRTYRSANGYVEFRCERVVHGIALGEEVDLKTHPYPPCDIWWHQKRRRTWHSVMAEGCWELVEDDGDEH